MIKGFESINRCSHACFMSFYFESINREKNLGNSMEIEKSVPSSFPVDGFKVKGYGTRMLTPVFNYKNSIKFLRLIR